MSIGSGRGGLPCGGGKHPEIATIAPAIATEITPKLCFFNKIHSPDNYVL